MIGKHQQQDPGADPSALFPPPKTDDEIARIVAELGEELGVWTPPQQADASRPIRDLESAVDDPPTGRFRRRPPPIPAWSGAA